VSYRYAVLGSGRQGTAAAYDLARFGDADYLLLADQSLSQAERAAARVNQLAGRAVAHAQQVEVQQGRSSSQNFANEALICGSPGLDNPSILLYTLHSS